MPFDRVKKFLGDLHYAMNVREHALVNYLLPEEKRKHLGAFAGRWRNFVETGTYLGETTAAMADLYDKVYTVEIHEGMYRKAAERFASRPSIQCFLGDSAHALADIVKLLDGPAVFWLDGHYSGSHTGRAGYDTPIEQELSIIFAHSRKDHVILIDDARLFVGRNSYPRIGKLRKFVRANSDYGMTIREDIIRLYHDPEWA